MRPRGEAEAGGDALLLALLAVFNEARDTHGAIQESLDLVTEAVGGRIGEIWLVGADEGQIDLRYSSHDASPAPAAFEAAGRCRGGRDVPAPIGGVLQTGEAFTGRLVGDAGRAPEAVTAGVRNALALPIRANGAVAGVLAVFGDALESPSGFVVDRLPSACHHLGRFLERVRAEGRIQEEAEELSALASTDSLTGLKNRREFDRSLRTIPRQPFAVLSVDVDHLKETNDAYGHAAGDALLRTVGSTLGLIVRGWDVMARVGGDEFAALLPGVGAFGAGLVAERMLAAMHALVLPSGAVRITAGWSAAPAGADPISVWQSADECMYRAKRNGRDRALGCMYERGESADIAERSYSDVVARILEGGELHTMFQPIVDLVDGSVIGYEALARPAGFASMDSVDAVFEAARTGGQMRELDWICRRRALEDARPLPADAFLFLNMSASGLLDPVHDVDQLLLLLSAVQRAPASVVIEITEHERIHDYGALALVLASYRAEGIRFALDDVGEGHSTLELLMASGSEYLKLGRSLTMTASRVGSRAAIAATLAFARASGAVVIAEGVENEFVSDVMKASGIGLGQGYGLGKPRLAAEIEDVGSALADRAALSGLRPRAASLRPG